MKPATISEIKKTLFSLEKEEVVEHCLRLIKYKKENKELLNYLLFESSNKTVFLSEKRVFFISEIVAGFINKILEVRFYSD